MIGSRTASVSVTKLRGCVASSPFSYVIRRQLYDIRRIGYDIRRRLKGLMMWDRELRVCSVGDA